MALLLNFTGSITTPASDVYSIHTTGTNTLTIMRITLLLIPISLLSASVYAQSRKPVDAFPTYQQIKPAPGEIVDYNAPLTHFSSYGSSNHLNLFDYPKRSVTYVVNGRPFTNPKRVKKLLNQTGVQLEQLRLGRPDEQGKRIIGIDYSIQKKPL